MTTPSLRLFEFTIPHVGVAKGRARATVRRKKGGAPILTPKGQPIIANYTPEKTRNFEALVRDCAAQARYTWNLPGAEHGELLTCPVDLLVEFRFAIPDAWPKWKRELAAQGLVHHTRKPDCSNLIKAIEDACNGVLFKDDGQVVGSIVDKRYTPHAECIIVHGYRRPGIACQAGAQAAKDLAAYDAKHRVEHRPLGERMRAAA